MSFNNRYVVLGANGLVNLTVPIAGGREQKKLITEIEIDHSTDWQKRHWRTIVSGYSKAPFFEHYLEDVKAMIFNPEKNLFNFNISILGKLYNWLNINYPIDFSSEHGKHVERDYRNKLLPKNFQNDTLNWQPKYEQVFEDRVGFQPNLSILDFLFCAGPRSRFLLDKAISS
jgi:hypothetical protein